VGGEVFIPALPAAKQQTASGGLQGDPVPPRKIDPALRVLDHHVVNTTGLPVIHPSGYHFAPQPSFRKPIGEIPKNQED
jgi:hypothetical protein